MFSGSLFNGGVKEGRYDFDGAKVGPSPFGLSFVVKETYNIGRDFLTGGTNDE